jgi:hypothetical protein
MEVAPQLLAPSSTTIGANVEMRGRALRDLLATWTGGLFREAWQAGSPCTGSSSAMLHVCRRCLRNVLGQDGTTRDAAG